MSQIAGYIRPGSIGEAFALLEGPPAVLIGGGSRLNNRTSADPIVVVDLQNLGLGGVTCLGDGTVRIGATTTLQELVDGAAIPEVVGEAARRELPSTLRAQSTIGGAIVSADPESGLLAALLVHDAVVSVERPEGTEELRLEQLLEALPFDEPVILTAVTIDTRGAASIVSTARTTADKAIVVAAARIGPNGRRRLALAGVAARPVLVGVNDALDPPGDFRGSGEYRHALAGVLAARAIEGVRDGAKPGDHDRLDAPHSKSGSGAH